MEFTRNLTPRFITQDLFPRDPTILVDQINPAFQDFERKVIVPVGDDGEMETFIPVEPSGEEASTGRGGKKLTRRFHRRSFGSGISVLVVIIRSVVVIRLLERPIDDGIAVKVADATDQVGRDGLREFGVGRRRVFSG